MRPSSVMTQRAASAGMSSLRVVTSAPNRVVPTLLAGPGRGSHPTWPTIAGMELLEIDVDPGDVTTLVVAMDGWTDAGRGGSLAAEHLRDQYPTQYVGAFDADRLYDFRDRRPTLSIDRGVLGSPDWPELVLHRVDTPGRPILLLTGGEPDFRWHTLLDDLTDLAEQLGLTNYVGLGAVPGPVPHTRPVRTITTSSDPALLDRYGHPHERVVVPASCQVIVETGMRDAGLTTLGLWARVPHYVAGEYPAAAAGLIHRLGDHLGIMIDTEELDEAADRSPRTPGRSRGWLPRGAGPHHRAGGGLRRRRG
jgi:hypothetical protein